MNIPPPPSKGKVPAPPMGGPPPPPPMNMPPPPPPPGNKAPPSGPKKTKKPHDENVKNKVKYNAATWDPKDGLPSNMGDLALAKQLELQRAYNEWKLKHQPKPKPTGPPPQFYGGKKWTPDMGPPEGMEKLPIAKQCMIQKQINEWKKANKGK